MIRKRNSYIKIKLTYNNTAVINCNVHLKLSIYHNLSFVTGTYIT